MIPWKIKQATKVMAVALVLALSGAPELLAQTAQSPAQAQAQPQQQQQSAPAPQQQSQRPSGVVPDPAAAPLQPAPSSNLPDAPSAQQQAPEAPPPSVPPTVAPKTQQQPLGAAAAEPAKTSGGAASKPAGTAIAPAKQKQVRSLLIKIGIIAGAGAALGTVYALTRSTPSLPPGATSTTATAAAH